MIAFHCPCGEPLAADPEHVGRTVRCPRCHSALEVPEPKYEFEPSDAPPLPAAMVNPSDPAGRPIRRMMAKAHAELDDDEVKRAGEWRPVVFTPGLIGGFSLFVVCSLLAVVSLLLYNLYLAIGLLFFAVLGLIRAVLSFVGRGVD